MLFYDIEGRTFCTVADIFRDWQTLKETEPENHNALFIAEMLEIILATVNGRNDLEITGLSHAEIDRLVKRIKRRLQQPSI